MLVFAECEVEVRTAKDVFGGVPTPPQITTFVATPAHPDSPGRYAGNLKGIGGVLLSPVALDALFRNRKIFVRIGRAYFINVNPNKDALLAQYSWPEHAAPPLNAGDSART